MLLRDVKDPRVGFVTITRVLLTDDLRRARVWFSCVGDDSVRVRCQAGLQSAAGYLKVQLFRRLKLRYAPELTFVFDPGVVEAERLSKLLRQPTTADGEV
jgi:ribosome-binding factor A